MSARANPARLWIDSAPPPRRYRAFLSYSHSDTKWAVWLMRRLEGFRVPARFHGRAAPIGEVGARIAPVFRDRDELPTAGDLGEVVRAALVDSATLIVICSPAAAQSRWVREEILTFKRLHGETHIFTFIVAGEPKAEGTPDDCFSPALRRELGPDGQLSDRPSEVAAADARPEIDGKEDALIRLVAGLIGVGFDDLRQREAHRRHRRMTWIAVGSTVGMAVMMGLATIAWIARDDARRRQEQGERLLEFMLGDMRSQVEKVGRVEALEKIGTEALAYFRSLNPREFRSPAMLIKNAKVLINLGEVEMLQLRYSKALAVFTEAYDRMSDAFARNPADVDIVFMRGQSEYWIGYVHWKTGDHSQAEKWLTRYRDTGAALVASDNSRSEWQGELAWGYHNLAALDIDRGNLDSARSGYLAELKILFQLAAEIPGDQSLRFRIVDANSWLGTVAERSGDFTEASARYSEQVSQVESLFDAERGRAKWQAKLADGLALHAGILAITGKRELALQRRTRAKELFDTLISSDPKNLVYQLSWCYLRVKEAQLVQAAGDANRALQIVEDAREKLEQHMIAAPTDRTLVSRLAGACRLQGELLDALKRTGAANAVARALELNESLIMGERVNDEIIGESAQALLVAGWLSTRDDGGSQKHWLRAAALLEHRVEKSNNWQLLDPAARILELLGRNSEQKPLAQRLALNGYEPLNRFQIGSKVDFSDSVANQK